MHEHKNSHIYALVRRGQVWSLENWTLGTPLEMNPGERANAPRLRTRASPAYDPRHNPRCE